MSNPQIVVPISPEPWCSTLEMQARAKGYSLARETDAQINFDEEWTIEYKYTPRTWDYPSAEQDPAAITRILELAVLEGDHVAQLALRVIVDTNPDYAEYRGTVEALNS